MSIGVSSSDTPRGRFYRHAVFHDFELENWRDGDGDRGHDLTVDGNIVTRCYWPPPPAAASRDRPADVAASNTDNDIVGVTVPRRLSLWLLPRRGSATLRWC